MGPVAVPRTSPGAAPLAQDEALWERALGRAQEVLQLASRGLGEAPGAALAVAVSAARQGDARAGALVGCVRRLVVRSEMGSELHMRCLRALARVGAPVDVRALGEGLAAAGRLPRIALTALAELAARDDAQALSLLLSALEGPLRADAAMLLSCICTDEALDALSQHLRSPGQVGIHAAAALVSAEDDPFAFELLCERLCEPADAVLAARALWSAAPEGERLMAAQGALARWARRGVAAAEAGRLVAAAVLTAGGRAIDLGATLRALSSEDDELVLLGAQASYVLGDAERARSAVLALLRRGPAIASHAFHLLVRWADLGDERALALVKSVLERRPVDLGRAASLEVLSAADRPQLHGLVERAITSADKPLALEASRALARLREPLALVPGVWL